MQEKHRGKTHKSEFGPHRATHSGVAKVLRVGLPLSHGQMHAKAKSPDDGEKGRQGASRIGAVAKCRGRASDQRKPRSPEEIDDAHVAEAQADSPEENETCSREQCRHHKERRELENHDAA